MQQVHEEYWTLDEVAERLKVSRRTVNRWIEEGELAAIRLGPAPKGSMRVAESDLKDFLQRHRIGREGDDA